MPVGYLHLNLMFYYTLNTRWDNVLAKMKKKEEKVTVRLRGGGEC